MSPFKRSDLNNGKIYIGADQLYVGKNLLDRVTRFIISQKQDKKDPSMNERTNFSTFLQLLLIRDISIVFYLSYTYWIFLQIETRSVQCHLGPSDESHESYNLIFWVLLFQYQDIS